MKKYLVLAMIVAISATLHAQTWTKVNGRWQYQFLRSDSTFTPPADTLASAPIGSLAVKNDIAYFKNTSNHWISLVGLSVNLATANLIATGNFTHNWAHKQLFIDSVSTFRLRNIETDVSGLFGSLKTGFQLTWSPNMFNPLTLGTSLRNAANTADSITSRFITGLNTAQMISSDGTNIGSVVAGKGNISIFAKDASAITSGISINPTYFTFGGRDSIAIQGVSISGGSFDSVIVLGPYNTAARTNRLFKTKATNLAAQNISNTNLTANSSYLHNWAGYNLNIDSIGLLALKPKGISVGINQHANLTINPASATNKIQLQLLTRTAANNADSLQNIFDVNGTTTRMQANNLLTGSGSYMNIDTTTIVQNIQSQGTGSIITQTFDLQSGGVGQPEYNLFLDSAGDGQVQAHYGILWDASMSFVTGNGHNGRGAQMQLGASEDFHQLYTRVDNSFINNRYSLFTQTDTAFDFETLSSVAINTGFRVKKMPIGSSSDSVIVADVSGKFKKLQPASALGRNLSNASLTANGSYSHNWANNQLLIDSIGLFQFSSKQFNATKNRVQHVLISGQGSSNSLPLYFSTNIRGAANSFDSIRYEFGLGVSNGGIMQSRDLVKSKTVAMYQFVESGTPTLQLLVDSNSRQGKIYIDPYKIQILARDSVYITATPTTTADSVFAVGLYDPATKANKMLKIPASALTSGVTLQQAITHSGLLTTSNTVNIDDNYYTEIANFPDFDHVYSRQINQESGTARTTMTTGADSSTIEWDGASNVINILSHKTGNQVDNIISVGGAAAIQMQSVSTVAQNSANFVFSATAGFQMSAIHDLGSGVINQNVLHFTNDSVSFSHDTSVIGYDGVLRFYLKNLPSSVSSTDSQLVKTAGGNIAYRATTATPYTKYVALLSQSGSSGPTATVLENTTGATVTFSRNSTGNYTGTFSSGVLTASKTWFSSEGSDTGGNVGYTRGIRTGTTTFAFLTKDTGGGNVDNWTECSIEIRIYP